VDTLIDIVLPPDNNISEATILEWLKAPGDPVVEHEPLLEVSTDKVTMEIASPVTGVLREIFSSSNTVVFPGSVLGRVQAVSPTTESIDTLPPQQDEDYNADAVIDRGAGEGPRLSPLVRRMLREHGLSASDVVGSGRDGRITHRDILARIEGNDTILENQDEEDVETSADSGFDGETDFIEEVLFANSGEASKRSDVADSDDPDFGVDTDHVEHPINEQSPNDQEFDVSAQEEGNLYSFLRAEAAEPQVGSTEFTSDGSAVELSDCGPPASDQQNAADFASSDGTDNFDLSLDDVRESTIEPAVAEASPEEVRPDFEESSSVETAASSFGHAGIIESAVDKLSHVLGRPDEIGSLPFEFESEISPRRPHTPMRRAIARHMVESVQKAPHVTAVFDADLTNVLTHRELHRSEAEQRGVRLTYTSYFIAAAVRAIVDVPEINSVWHDDGLEIISEINVGVATALEGEGLIVPVVHNAHELDLFGIARRLQDLVSSARNNTLGQADVSGGTFTITNHGVSGSLIATPIINQPQSAILGIGRLEKRVVVKQFDGRDSIQVAPMVYVTLTIDHRGLDGFQANRFLSRFVSILETWELSQMHPQY
jgi:pyruvate/2-oxoglutarate dehydrogenase complex dihydrolipoamide acyltransferase (E2) component